MNDLKKLAASVGLVATLQDNKIILYNNDRRFWSSAVQVESQESAKRLVSVYRQYVSVHGISPISDFVSDYEGRLGQHVMVHNKVQQGSAYYEAHTVMSSASRVSLLKAAKSIQTQVENSYCSRVARDSVTIAEVRRYKKLKQAAALLFGNTDD